MLHEAGEFILRNLKVFPNELPESAFDTLRKSKQIHFISAPTENAQARYIPEWIRGIKNYKLQTTNHKEEGWETSEKENAVVLCNEALLLPVLHSIPSESEECQYHHGISFGTNARIQLYQRSTGNADYRLSYRYGTIYLRKCTFCVETFLYTSTLTICGRLGGAVNERQPFLSSPFRTKERRLS